MSYTHTDVCVTNWFDKMNLHWNLVQTNIYLTIEIHINSNKLILIDE